MTFLKNTRFNVSVLYCVLNVEHYKIFYFWHYSKTRIIYTEMQTMWQLTPVSHIRKSLFIYLFSTKRNKVHTWQKSLHSVGLCFPADKNRRASERRARAGVKRRWSVIALISLHLLQLQQCGTTGLSERNFRRSWCCCCMRVASVCRRESRAPAFAASATRSSSGIFRSFPAGASLHDGLSLRCTSAAR